MSTRELLMMQCDRCGARLPLIDLPTSLQPYVDRTRINTALFYSHTAAHRAATAAGWRCMSESIGGDVCASCVDKEVGDE